MTIRKRVFNATRGKWVDIIKQDEPGSKETLKEVFARLNRGEIPDPLQDQRRDSQDRGQSR